MPRPHAGDVRNELDAQLRAQIEPLSFAQILDPVTASARLKEAAERVEAAATPSFWRGVGIWFSSFGDPDDVIAFKVLFFVAVNGDLADTVDAQLATGLPDSVVGRDLPDPLGRQHQLTADAISGNPRRPWATGHHDGGVTSRRASTVLSNRVSPPLISTSCRETVAP